MAFQVPKRVYETVIDAGNAHKNVYVGFLTILKPFWTVYYSPFFYSALLSKT